MAKATDEGQALEHMTLQHRRGHLSGQFGAWTRAKLSAVERGMEELEFGHPQVLDLGVGDLSVPRLWDDFTTGRVRYTGVDFVPDVLDRAAAAFPLHRFLRASFSEVPTAFALEGCSWDMVLLLDVLYHIPDPDVARALQDWAFTVAEHVVVVSYATDCSQVFNGGQRPGDSGYCWFPRVFRRPDPREWESIHRADADTQQRQTLEVFLRHG